MPPTPSRPWLTLTPGEFVLSVQGGPPGILLSHLSVAGSEGRGGKDSEVTSGHYLAWTRVAQAILMEAVSMCVW